MCIEEEREGINTMWLYSRDLNRRSGWEKKDKYGREGKIALYNLKIYRLGPVHII